MDDYPRTLMEFERQFATDEMYLGGPSNGYRLLSDSNLDFGQGLVDLRRWMRANRIERIALAYHGSVDPSVYGINYTPLIWPKALSVVEGEFLEPWDEALVGISAWYLQGLHQRIATPRGRTNFRCWIPFWEALQAEPPVTVVGSVIFLYRRDSVLRAWVNTEAQWRRIYD